MLILIVLVYFKQQFIDDILGCGLLLYLSPAWLSELYHQVITTDLLAEAGFDREKHRESPFITMIIGRFLPSSQLTT